MAYTKQGPFTNDGPPALSADVMNAIDNGIESAHDLSQATSDLPTDRLPDLIPVANMPASSLLIVRKVGGVWPSSFSVYGVPNYSGGTASTGARPTSRSDISVFWKGATPFPPIVTSGAAGVRDGLDMTFEE